MQESSDFKFPNSDSMPLPIGWPVPLLKIPQIVASRS